MVSAPDSRCANEMTAMVPPASTSGTANCMVRPRQRIALAVTRRMATAAKIRSVASTVAGTSSVIGNQVGPAAERLGANLQRPGRQQLQDIPGQRQQLQQRAGQPEQGHTHKRRQSQIPTARDRPGGRAEQGTGGERHLDLGLRSPDQDGRQQDDAEDPVLRKAPRQTPPGARLARRVGVGFRTHSGRTILHYGRGLLGSSNRDRGAPEQHRRRHQDLAFLARHARGPDRAPACSLGRTASWAAGRSSATAARSRTTSHIYDAVVLEDDVFVGPSAVFTRRGDPPRVHRTEAPVRGHPHRDGRQYRGERNDCLRSHGGGVRPDRQRARWSPPTSPRTPCFWACPPGSPAGHAAAASGWPRPRARGAAPNAAASTWPRVTP